MLYELQSKVLKGGSRRDYIACFYKGDTRSLDPKPQSMRMLYLEGHGDLVSRLITPRNHVIAQLSPLFAYIVTKSL